MLIYQRVASYDEYGEVKLIKFRFMLEPIPQRVLQTLAASSDVGLNQYIRAWVKRMFGYTASDSHKSQVWMLGFGWLNLRNFEMFLTMQSQLGPCIYIYIFKYNVFFSSNGKCVDKNPFCT